MSKKKPAVMCLFCDERPALAANFLPSCKPCGDLYDRDATQYGADASNQVRWIAERVRRYERARTRKKHAALEKLTQANMQFIAYVDSLMKQPATVERGKLIARALNALEMLNDSVRYSDLGVDFRTDTRELREGMTQEQMTEMMRILGLTDG